MDILDKTIRQNIVKEELIKLIETNKSTLIKNVRNIQPEGIEINNCEIDYYIEKIFNL